MDLSKVISRHDAKKVNWFLFADNHIIQMEKDDITITKYLLIARNLKII